MQTKYKAMMGRVEKMLAAKPSVSPSSGLLSPSKAPKQTPTTGPEATIAKYVALIRKQRQELTK
jgi:hypothetical protein